MLCLVNFDVGNGGCNIMPKIKLKGSVLSIHGKKSLEAELEGSLDEIMEMAEKILNGFSF